MANAEGDRLPGYYPAMPTIELDWLGNKVEQRDQRGEETDEVVIPVDTLTLPLLTTSYRELSAVAS